MKKIIKGKMYNTETAEMVGKMWESSPRDFSFYREKLYRKKTGEFFLYGEGGPASKYAERCGLNEWCGGSKIMPFTEEEAREWAERELTADEYIKIFGEVKE